MKIKKIRTDWLLEINNRKSFNKDTFRTKWFQWGILPFKKLIPIILTLFKKMERERTILSSLRNHCYPILKTDKHTIRKSQAIIPNNIDTSIFNKIMANLIQQYIKRIIPYHLRDSFQAYEIGSTFENQSIQFTKTG